MKIITKRQAENMMIDSLFTAGRTNTIRERFDMGKYAGPPSRLIGQDVPDINGVVAVYPVAKRDKNGQYVALMSLS